VKEKNGEKTFDVGKKDENIGGKGKE